MRFTPAWAGSSSSPGGARRAGPVPRRGGVPVPLVRSTPAWAGSSAPGQPRASPPPVHPRMGGEFASSLGPGEVLGGPPPHGRGVLGREEVVDVDHRSTPAWAGSSRTTTRGLRSSPVHPRMGGEFVMLATLANMLTGPPPHGRGVPAGLVDRDDQIRSTPAWAGSSKTGRYSRRQPRSTPAWAGSSGRGVRARGVASVHPRMGGEFLANRLGMLRSNGPPPHGRGVLLADLALLGADRSTPAWAGSSFIHRMLGSLGAVHPRMGGEFSC